MDHVPLPGVSPHSGQLVHMPEPQLPQMHTPGFVDVPSIAARPRGRPPKGQSWDTATGRYVTSDALSTAPSSFVLAPLPTMAPPTDSNDDGPDSKHLGVDPPVGKVWDHSTAKYVELPWDGSHHSVLVPTSVPNPKPADQPAQAHPVHLSPHSADAWASAPVGENLDNPQPAQHLRPMPTFQNEPPAHQQVSHASVHSHPHQAQPVQSQAAHPMQPVHHPQVSTAPVGAGQPHQTQRPQQAHQPLQQQQAQHHQQHMAHQSQRKKMTKPTGTPKPRGRPPKHHYWDGVLGKYVPEAQSTIALPVTYSSSVVKRKDEGVILGSEDKRRRVSLGRPRGRPPKDCRWDNDQGRYVQMVEAQPLPTAAHVEAAIQHAVAVQPPNMAPVLAQLPTQAVTQMMNPPQALS